MKGKNVTMDINDQIAKLRRKKGSTQEELASALGVTNQAVSKWESGQCCPDIQLLPSLATYFHVSIDNLMGLDAPEQGQESQPTGAENGGQAPADPVRETARLALLLSEGSLPESNRRALDAALSLHAALFYKRQPAWSETAASPEGAVEAVRSGPWGYSAVSEPDITTVMRGKSVLFSGNTALDLDRGRIHTISLLCRTLGKESNLDVLSALYGLTVHDEDAYAHLSAIKEACSMTVTQEDVAACLEGDLFPYICERGGGYRIRGEAMAILPILSLLCY